MLRLLSVVRPKDSQHNMSDRGKEESMGLEEALPPLACSVWECPKLEKYKDSDGVQKWKCH